MLVAGIGIFLVACSMMSQNLESVSGNGLRTLFGKISSNKLIGVGIGAVGTAAIQSSGAVTVMVIGFVNVGVMSLMQAATVIYGANIGTTITAQIVALGLSSGGGVSTTTIFASMAGIGAFMQMFAKEDLWKKVGGIITGFGMLFVGLSMMSGAMKDFAQLDAVKLFLASIDNAILLVLIGAIFTAIIQSSSVMTSVAITMAVTGLISLNQGIYLTLGSNIGSCVVAIIAGMTSGLNAKRTALIHLIFNCFGVVVFLLVAGVMYLVTQGTLNFGIIFENMFPDAPQLQMAMFHTIFNVATVIIILPLTQLLVDTVCKIIPEKEGDVKVEFTPHFFFVDETMLRTPALAVRQVKLEIERMASVAMHNYDLSLEMITNLDFSQEQEFKNNEVQLNFLNRQLVNYIIRLNSLPMSEEDHLFLTNSIRTTSDIERIGDYAENITEYAHILMDHGAHFSETAMDEIEMVREKIFDVYQQVMKAYMELDKPALERAMVIEDEVDGLTDQMELNHVDRLTNGRCTPLVGQQFLELASDSERISDHFINVGKTVLDIICLRNRN